MVGQILAHYKILEKIGSGGMGEVYLAEDTKLDRKVALKVLPTETATGDRRTRFEREAKAVAALDHPNIVTIHSVEEADGLHFITMQLVKGKTLTELIPKKGLPLNKFFEIAIPLAEAVSAAHEQGIVHRDLKPDNLMMSDDGRLKILDFGLAKLKQESAQTGVSELPTQPATQEGRILGTVAYMSPEQAEGKQVDHRTDIFSIGIILYEMLTGQRPFRGDTPASILSSIIKDTPDSVTELNPTIPRDLAKTIKRCLSKDPLRRYQTAIDLRNELEEAKQEVDSGEAVVGPVPTQMKRARSTKTLSVVATAITLVVIAWVTGIIPTADDPSRPAVPRFTNPVQITSALGVEDYPTWSPDGRTLAYAAAESGRLTSDGAADIWVTQVEGGPPVNRTADHVGADLYPSWSPDGSQIAFWSSREGEGYFVMSALGGSARKVISSGGMSGPPSWSADGQELAGVVSDFPGVFVEIASLRTRESRRLLLPGQTHWRLGLNWSPDGRFFAFVDAPNHLPRVAPLWILRVEDEKDIAVTDGRTRVWSPSWSEDGRNLYFVSNRGGSMDLWRQPLGPEGTPEGEPAPMTVGIGMIHAAFSPDGTKLAYSRGGLVANLWRVPILEDRRATWADAQQLTHDQAYVASVDVAPDGKRLLVDSDRGGNMDVWMLPVDGGDVMQVTTDPAPDLQARWSPDGQEIVFNSYRSGNRRIWVMPVSGGPARQVTLEGSGMGHVGGSWSPDGREIAFSMARESEGPDIYIVPAEGGEARQLTTHLAGDWYPSWSPDGKWLIFDSEETGNYRPWRVPAVGGDPEPLTDAEGNFPRWSRDGKRIFFLRSGNIWTVSLEGGSERPMTDLAGRRGEPGRWCLATDGRHLYFAWQESLGDIWVMDVVTEE